MHKEKNKNNEYFANKEKNRMKMKLNKVEKDISVKEQAIKEVQTEMANEEVYSDYISLAELQEKLKILNNELDNLLDEWEKISNVLE